MYYQFFSITTSRPFYKTDFFLKIFFLIILILYAKYNLRYDQNRADSPIRAEIDCTSKKIHVYLKVQG
jgi:hypothetical protein